jgi:hypothetical protein
MTKIGNTNSDIFSMALHQYFVVVACGGEMKWSPPHPDVAEEWNAATFSVPYDFGSPKPEPVVRDALLATSAIVAAIGNGRIASVEKLPVEGDEEVKYTITIKKAQEYHDNNTEANRG